MTDVPAMKSALSQYALQVGNKGFAHTVVPLVFYRITQFEQTTELDVSWGCRSQYIHILEPDT